jgi:hypothetical protein
MKRQAPLQAFFNDLRKKRIIEILAAFVGGFVLSALSGDHRA